MPAPSVSRLYFCSLVLICSAFICEHARAEELNNASVDALLKAVNEQGERLATDEKKMEDSKKALDEQQRNLLQERAKFNDLKAKVSKLTGREIAEPAPSKAATAEKTAAEPSPAVPPSSGQQAGVPQEVGTEKKQDAGKPPDITALTDQGGILLRKGQIVLTPAIEYTRSSATAVEIQGFSIIPALNVGLFDISKVNRDEYTASMDALYGLTNKAEIELKVPYVYRNDSTLTRPIGGASSSDTLFNASGRDIGDVEVSGHYQLNTGQNGWPFMIGNLRFKTATGTNPYEVPVNSAGVETKLPTGSGFYALQPSVTFIYPSDPVVFYSNVGYLHNFTRSFPTVGKINPGDNYNASFGMSFALNDKASYSLGYSHTMVAKPTQNGATPANATVLQVGTLDLGYSYSINDHTNLNFLVSAGVTSDAPDIHLTFRVPLTYDLFGNTPPNN